MCVIHASLYVQRILRDATYNLDNVVLWNHGKICVLLNSNVCNSCGREILSCFKNLFYRETPCHYLEFVVM